MGGGMGADGGFGGIDFSKLGGAGLGGDEDDGEGDEDDDEDLPELAEGEKATGSKIEEVE